MEVPPKVAAIPHAMVLRKPQNNRSAEEKCTWGLHCPIYKKKDEEGTEDTKVTLNSAYHEDTFHEKLPKMKENLYTKYTAFTYKYITLWKAVYNETKSLHIFFHYRQSWVYRPENQQRSHYPQNPQYSQIYDVPDQYSDQIRLRREWDEKMEHLNEKYNLDYYFSLKSISDFETEYKYETLI